ncbi:MAG: divergent PAP2 family protein [Anaerolineaceae bacterium]|jgi:acid phosphatase family membrane protein YuiD|nr:divergent PAP2 family protein [Anaerolineaceae bacterium]
MNWLDGYPVLTCTVVGWLVSSLLKIPFTYFVHRKIDLKQAFGTGGMPSSHSALMVSTTLGIGLFQGFNAPEFALAIAVSMIVLYDAAGVRRQAGIHAERINMIIKELFEGKPLQEDDLKVMLGHSPLEVTGGVLTGILTALFVWLVWPK